MPCGASEPGEVMCSVIYAKVQNQDNWRMGVTVARGEAPRKQPPLTS